MSYFASAQETAQALAVPLLLRGDADPASLVRHERLSRYAAPTAHAARLYARFREVLQTSEGGWPSGGQVVWVAGPWGTLEHLPGAVGLADQLARSGARVWLAERTTDGPISALAPGVRPAIEAPERAGIALGATSLVDAGSDLAGVRLLLAAPLPSPASPAAAATARRNRAGWLILADALPEELDGPYPGADGIDGVVLVVAFRDHGRYELEAIARGLRAGGHRIVGLVAVGPESVGAAASAGTVVPEPAVVPGDAPRSVEEVERPVMPEPVPVANEDGVSRDSGLSGAAEVPAPETAAPEIVAPEIAATEIASPETAAPEIAATEIASPETAAPEIAAPEIAAPEIVAPEIAVAEGVPPRRVNPPAVESPVVEAPERPMALLSSWDRAASVDRRRTRAWTRLATIAALLLAVGILYLLFLRPRGIRFLPKPAASPAARVVPETSGGSPEERQGGGVDAIPGPADSGLTAAAAPIGLPEFHAGDETDIEGGASDSSVAERLGGADTTGGVQLAPLPGGPSGSDGLETDEGAGGASPESAAIRATAGPGDYVIHLSSFKLAPEAEEELARLRALGIEARALRVDVPGRGSWYRIVAGRFASFAEAESVALSWEVRGLIPYAHIAPDGGQGTPVLAGARDNPRP